MKAVCVGINKYKYFPSNSLYKCVNDANDMANLFKSKGVEVTLLIDKEATYKNVYNALEEAILSDSVVLFSQSSHGTQIYDIDGDELDGNDEAFVMYDTTTSFKNILTDDDIVQLINLTDKCVELWLDCCHSGTGQRLLSSKEVCRYMPNPNLEDFRLKEVSKLKTLAKENKSVILWSGCKSNQYSYESDTNGAFTRAWLNAFNSVGKSCRSTIYRKTLKNIAEMGFSKDQTPQLECNMYRKYSGLRFKD